MCKVILDLLDSAEVTFNLLSSVCFTTIDKYKLTTANYIQFCIIYSRKILCRLLAYIRH